jgi:protein O-mannosyl-transferase
MRDPVRRRKTPKGSATAQSSSRANSGFLIGNVCILLAGIVWIVFGQTLRHEFVNYDDDEYVRGNPRITTGLTLEGIRWAFTHVHAANWHPLTTISHMLDCQLYGLQPWGHHLTNVLLHAAATVFLFLALRQLTGAHWPSAFVAAVFAIHPLRVESVAWVAERKDVLSGVFFMLTLWAYARYARSNRPSSGRYIIALALFALGLLCKPTLVTLPFVLLLLDYWPLRRFALQSPGSKPPGSMRDHVAIRHSENPSRGGSLPTKPVQYLLIEKIPFFVLSAASCVATILAQERAVRTIQQLNFGDRVANAMVSYVAYLGQMIWPVGLSLVYPYHVGGRIIAQALLASLVLLIISVVFFIWRRKYPFLLVGWLWFLGVLVPMIGIVQVGSQARADRYTYLAQIGLYLLVTWGALELPTKWRGGREVLIAVAVLIVTGLTADSYLQTSYWRNGETLWSQALANTSDNALAQSNLGDALMRKGQLDDAVVHLRKALEIKANFAEANNSLGYVLMKKGQLDEAVVHFRKALASNPNFAEANNNLGFVLMKKGQMDDAVVYFRKAVEINPEYPNANYNLAFALGYALAQKGNMADAITSYRAALRIRPNDPIVRNNLAASLAAMGKTDEAIEQFREVLRLDGNYQEAHVNLASMLLQLGRRDEAVAELREALRLNPDDAQVKAQLRQLGVER